MRSRVDSLGVSEPQIQTTGNNLITVGLPNVSDTARAEREVGTTAQLAFYDWEANVLTPNGKTVASQLQAQDPTATHDQPGSRRERRARGSRVGEHGALPGGPARLEAAGVGQLGQLAHRAAVLRCSGRPGARRARRRRGEQARCPPPASTACSHGPDDNLNDLQAGLPQGVTASEGRSSPSRAAWVVLQATPANFSHPTPIGDPSAQFFVLKDNIALRGNNITNPQQSTDPNTGRPTSRSASAARARRPSRT